MSWLKQIKQGLQKSSDKITDQLQNIFVNKKLTHNIIEELEESLIQADINIKVVVDIIDKFKHEKFSPDITAKEAASKLAIIIEDILLPYTGNLYQSDKHNHVNLFIICGVNGNGKTTTIGKLSAQYTEKKKKILVAACDTYRAAAVSQLEIWATKAKVDIFVGKENADPASVAYSAIEQALKNNYQYVFLDTAGRLHNQTNLMQELIKIVNISNKFRAIIEKKIILVLDATTGQSAYNQIELFNASVKLDGVIVTKLDSGAKAGVVVGIAGKYRIPIYAIGIGEEIDDLQPFDAKDFSRNLLGLE